MVAECPDDSVLDAFVRGELTDRAVTELDRHLDRCDSCGELVAVLAQSHTRPTTRADGRAPEIAGAIGRYTVRQRLGEGAAGQVFLGWDPSLEREVALKLLRPERASDLVARERLLREASALASLSHPNVVTVFDVGVDNDTVYVAMEVVRGPSLRALCEQGSCGPERALAIVRAVGEGLAAAHAKGLFHRDVKPENIIVGDDRPRLADFGLASDVRGSDPRDAEPTSIALTRTGALLGTPLYMAPEALSGAPATERSDLYSLAVTLYECLAHKRPFDGATVEALRASIHEGAPPITTVSPALDRAVRAALDEVPSRRPASVRAWLAMLDASRSARRSTPRAALTVAALVCVGALGVARQRSPRPAVVEARTCRDGAAVAQAWRRETRGRSAISTAFLRINPRTGATVARLFFASIERFNARWAAQVDASCTATFVQHTQSREAFEARSSCLAEARREVDATVASVASTEPAAMLRASVIDDELPTLSRCSDARALLGRVARPAAAPSAAAVARAESEIERSAASMTAGVYQAAESHARAAVEQAREALWGPVEARARRALSRALRGQGKFSEAASEARRAALTAEASRDDDTAARAWLDLVSAEGARGAWSDTLRAIEQAEASVTRVGDPSLAASLELLRAIAATNLGRLDDAQAAAERSDGLRMQHGGDRSPVFTARANIARQRGQLEDALRLHTEAMRLDRERLGEEHPVHAAHLHNIAGVERRLSRWTDARTHYLSALEIERRWLGDRSLEAGLTQNSLGLLALETRAIDEAERFLTEARAILTGRGEASLAELNLALVAIEKHQYSRAVALAEGALVRDTAAFGAGHLRPARAAKVRAIALIGAGRISEARASIALALRSIDSATDAESRAVADECAALERSLDERARPIAPNVQRVEPTPRAVIVAPVARPDAGPTSVRADAATAARPSDAAATNAAPAHSVAAPSGSGSYGPAQRWAP